MVRLATVLSGYSGIDWRPQAFSTDIRPKKTRSTSSSRASRRIIGTAFLSGPFEHMRDSIVDRHRTILSYTPWPSEDFHADTSFEINPPSYSMLRMKEHPEVGGDTAWVSQYGLYDALSDAMKKHLDGLHAVHTSRLQYDTIFDLYH